MAEGHVRGLGHLVDDLGDRRRPLNCLAWELNVPVVTAVMTVSWNDFGIPIRFSWRIRLEISWPFTIDPRTPRRRQRRARGWCWWPMLPCRMLGGESGESS